MGKGYLLLINIGPVQGFIATARRTRDLYAGSRLLSEAAGKIAERLLERDVVLVFPAVQNRDELEALRKAGIPNAIMGIVNEPDPGRVADLAEAAREAMRTFLEETMASVFGRKKTQAVLKNPDAARRQVLDSLEFYWAAVPLNGDYPAARARVQRLMGARKNTRDFAPVAWGGPVPKSSLSGSLESVTYGANDADKYRAGLREGEELSGVDLLKRRYLALEEGSPRGTLAFASTTHMALLPFLAGQKKEDLETAEAKARALQSKLGVRYDGWPPDHLVRAFPFLKEIDPRLFFPSRHRELAHEGGHVGEKAPLWEETQRELADFYRQLKREPYPYYALLLADGDRMGKAIDHQQSMEGHQRISARLTEFSKKVKEIVEKHLGSLIYSGGDDVLALLPLHTALQCASELARAFEDALAEFTTGTGRSPTLSVGIAVVHHLFDLGEALNLARKAEKEAKKTRNALAVVFSPRSGAETAVSGSWDEAPPLNERLERFARWLNQDRIPGGFAYELREAASALLSSGDEEEKALLAEEAVRILKRKAIAEKEVVGEIRKHIQCIGPDRLTGELVAARPFAAAMALAGKEDQ